MNKLYKIEKSIFKDLYNKPIYNPFESAVKNVLKKSKPIKFLKESFNTNVEVDKVVKTKYKPYRHRRPYRPWFKYGYKKPLKKNIGHLLLFKRHSNVFIVLTNFKKKHIITLTSGNCLLGKKKKEKMAVHNMLKIVNKLIKILKKFNMKFVYIFIRQRLSAHFFNLYKLLKKNSIYILFFKFILRKPHGFIKRRKLRRI